MVDFSFTEEQENFRKIMREFALKELAPKYSYWDKCREYPFEQQRKMVGLKRKLGLEGKAIDCVTLGVGIEEVARGDFNCSLPFLAAFGNPLFLKEAPEKVKKEWPELIYGGEKVVSLCLTERDIGSDVGSISTTAKKDGDDYYVLNGEKTRGLWIAYCQVSGGCFPHR